MLLAGFGFILSRTSFLGALSLSFLPPSTLLPTKSASHRSPPIFDDPFSPSAARFRSEITSIIQQDASVAGPLIRLAFHDAATLERDLTTTTGGPNGSIRYEMERRENRAVGRPFKIVESLWSSNNDYDDNGNSFSTQFSLADAIALSGAAAVEATGGPHIGIRMGRKDVDTADAEVSRVVVQKSTPRSRVDRTLPSAALDSDGLRLFFGRLGLSEQEFVALCGSHGLGRHVSLLGMSKPCLKNLTRTCLEEAPVLLPFVTSSVDTFDNSYFSALLQWNSNQVELGEVAFIPTDVALVVDRGLRVHVERFARDQAMYFTSFARAYQKLVDSTAVTVKRY
ncbi:putative ascorbate peroxidase [Fragilariopsis cylindrus CCMP1102]|uniref:Putative ascorbate peroxidase n=1 Tax=Fragilariopsis cylindrus CCMP1102 TaxID=635003 RepID=A0A1E7EWE1_9STRA|nr:putative ascorbate peroxidase [Fragilariopsis cylindrus CCMP1102]|eukprot:OEU10281.1 putative ascorbate peroxidase [Fragilariopsis cylindrus CCMP1102]